MLFPNSHQCPPVYVCGPADRDGYGDGYDREIFARDPEFAAEKFAEEWDSEEYHMLRTNSELSVRVVSPSGDVSFWSVTAESVPTYNAYPQDEGPDQ